MKPNLVKLLIALGLAGLACGMHHRHFHRHRLPHGSRVVGGGLAIEWTAPEPGSAILREETTRRVVATQTLEAGDSFDFPSHRTTKRPSTGSSDDPNAHQPDLCALLRSYPPPKE